LTARAVAESLVRFAPFPADEILVSGGGVNNKALMAELHVQMGDIPIELTNHVEVASEAKEALAFALLGAATLDGIPSNVPSATGAKRVVVLGSVTPVPF
jgi:anhydro-N-acetylmuramic acid kinase